MFRYAFVEEYAVFEANLYTDPIEEDRREGGR